MSKGDTVTVTVRTPVGFYPTVVEARTVGSKIDVDEPKQNEPYLAIEEQDRNGNKIRRFLFAKTEVLSVVEGQVEKVRGKTK
jgi:hypothetical protein